MIPDKDNRPFSFLDNFKPEPLEYVIGVNFDFSAYCLVLKTEDNMQVILCKGDVRNHLEEEINNLSKYFNATILIEKY